MSNRSDTMKKFMGPDFLLNNETQKELFVLYAKDKPIFDWHCHLSAKEIFENKAPEDLCELWLSGDHYKWRAMRSAGIEEKYITGAAEPFEKFEAYAKVLSLAVGNPLYHWSHLELQRYFGIDTPLSPDTAKEIWDKTKEKIKGGGFTPRELISVSNVFALCTTDDPADSLEYHRKLLGENLSFRVLPAFRPDKVINIETHDFPAYLSSLSAAASLEINTFSDLKEALCRRMDFFKSLGAVASDQSVSFVPYAPADDGEVEKIFKKAKSGAPLSKDELAKYKFSVLCFLGRQYAQKGFVMEIHLGAMRNNNSRAFLSLGADSGFDSIDDSEQARGLSLFLDTLDRERLLPKTVLFNLNPKDNFVFGSMLGNFQSAEANGKLQFGSAWWFNDNLDGMTAQIKALANLGVLGCFVGMVTDSRSFLSYPRHEYFRRILCHIIGSWVNDGLYPFDEKALKKIIGGICFDNAKEYFLSGE